MDEDIPLWQATVTSGFAACYRGFSSHHTEGLFNQLENGINFKKCNLPIHATDWVHVHLYNCSHVNATEYIWWHVRIVSSNGLVLSDPELCRNMALLGLSELSDMQRYIHVRPLIVTVIWYVNAPQWANLPIIPLLYLFVVYRYRQGHQMLLFSL